MNYILAPGVFIGLPILDTLCARKNFGICARNFGSGTSTGETYFILIGALIFYAAVVSVVWYVILKYRANKIGKEE